MSDRWYVICEPYPNEEEIEGPFMSRSAAVEHASFLERYKCGPHVIERRKGASK